MWECPKCKREFKTLNQWHSCSTYTVEEFFEKKSQTLKEIYYTLEKLILNISDFIITATKTAVLFRKSSTFVEIKLRKDYLILSFSLNKFSDSSKIRKTFKMSQNKIVHSVYISTQSDIDNELLDILKNAYKSFK